MKRKTIVLSLAASTIALMAVSPVIYKLSKEQTEKVEVIEEAKEHMELVTDKKIAMKYVGESTTITANVVANEAVNKTLIWSLDCEDGKNFTEYLRTSISEDTHSITITKLKSFAGSFRLLCKSEENPNMVKTCMIYSYNFFINDDTVEKQTGIYYGSYSANVMSTMVASGFKNYQRYSFDRDPDHDVYVVIGFKITKSADSSRPFDYTDAELNAFKQYQARAYCDGYYGMCDRVRYDNIFTYNLDYVEQGYIFATGFIDVRDDEDMLGDWILEEENFDGAYLEDFGFAIDYGVSGLTLSQSDLRI